MAMENAKVKLTQLDIKSVGYKEIQDFIIKEFKLKNPVKRIECFDVSHCSGKDVVGAKVSFFEFRPDKNNYRCFHIKNMPGQDDYASLYEILTRSIKKSLKENILPDMILIDGGKGHLSVLSRVLNENNIELLGLGIAKESHSKSSRDKLYLPFRKNPLKLKPNSPFLLKMMEIRDEAHRFAIMFHKKQREKKLFKY
jgi:excinuclease ABC subunit C